MSRNCQKTITKTRISHYKKSQRISNQFQEITNNTNNIFDKSDMIYNVNLVSNQITVNLFSKWVLWENI